MLNLEIIPHMLNLEILTLHMLNLLISKCTMGPVDMGMGKELARP